MLKDTQTHDAFGRIGLEMTRSWLVSSIGALAIAASSTTLAADANADFSARCQGASVVRCVNFDNSTSVPSRSTGPYGVLAGTVLPAIDSSVAASGGGSLKFTIPSNSGSGDAGSYFADFSDDLSVQFDGGQEFYVQWRQRFSPELLNTRFTGSAGFKQIIIGTGDQPGKQYYSCTALETVVQNNQQRGFAQMYNSCTGSASHGAYYPFEEPFGSYDYKLQNARPAPYCLYSQSSTSYFPPTGNCIGYFPNEWMTFQVGIRLGQRVGDEFVGSYISLWISRENGPTQQAYQFGPFNLSAGDPATNQRFGKLWLLPYQTGKDASQAHPVGYTWYDELIVSRTRIADPGQRAAPNPPTNVLAR